MTATGGKEGGLTVSRWEEVAQVAMALGEELSFDALSSHALDRVLSVLGADAGALYAPADHGLELRGQRGLPSDFDRDLATLSLDAPTITARAATTGELQLLPDAAEIPAGLHLTSVLARRFGLASLAAVPLRGRGQFVGVLTFGTRRRRQFNATDVSIIRFVAHAFATGILNARAFDAERRMRSAMQAVDEATLAIAAEFEPHRVLQAIVDRAREVAGARYAALGIGTNPDKQFDPWVFSGIDEEHARAIGRYPRVRGLLGAVPASGHVIRVRDISADPRSCGWPAAHPQMRSFLGIPIQAGGESIGNLYVADKIGAEQFSAEDERAVASLAAHAAIAYRHAQLYEQAQAERSRLRAVLESSPLGIIFVDAATGHLFANPAAEELFGYPIVPEAGRDQYVAWFGDPDGHPLAAGELPSSRALRGESVIGRELVLRRPDGREVPVLASAEPIKDAHGQVAGAVVIWQDITPLKLEQLREEFISLVAHELRAPITVIAGYADLLGRGQQGDLERRATDNIRVSARRLERLVQDLLDASRIEARRLQLEKRPVDVATLTIEVVDRLAGVMERHAVPVEVRGKPPMVLADAGRVEQVLTNLLTNAAKYSPPESEVRVAVEEEAGEVIVSVQNEGPGIPADELPRLFTRFYRTRSAQRGKAQGLGLGLYIARGLIEAHGGRIWATSRPKQGATFCFAIPVRSNPASAQA